MDFETVKPMMELHCKTSYPQTSRPLLTVISNDTLQHPFNSQSHVLTKRTQNRRSVYMKMVCLKIVLFLFHQSTQHVKV